ncbi:hypothetical protein Leryth_026128 [Lithospermum erythrorhizon]|nr:hypothetical protein Leryth_026128 [Lithospermum erythrorhizon]
MQNAERNEETWNQIAKDVTSNILNDSQGLLQGGITPDESVEDVGKRYVDALINRSLVIPIKMKTEGGVKRGMFDLSICPRRILINRDMDMHLPFISVNSVRTIISFVEGEITRMLDFQHMMLLNVLDIHAHTDPSSFLDHFVHLYLALWEIDCSHTILLQLSFSKLMNLQVLILSLSNLVKNAIKVPDFILDLVKLRHIQLLPRALFPRHDSKRLQDSPVLLENLKSLSKPCLHYGDSNWLRKLPGLQKLSCIMFTSWDYSLQQYRFPELDLCNLLTSLKIENGAKMDERKRVKLHFPASLRKLSLSDSFSTSMTIKLGNLY